MRSNGFVRAATLLALLSLAACATVNEAPVVELSTDPGARSRQSSEVSEPAPAARIAAPGEHVVAGGDTLYGIAFRHGLDYRALAEWNRIPPPFTIRPGQVLSLRAPEPSRDMSTVAAPVAVPVDTGVRPTPVELPGGTVVLVAPDSADAPLPGEARTYGIDGAGDTAPLAFETVPSPSGLPAAEPRVASPPARPLDLPATVASDPEPLRPAPDGEMPPPSPRLGSAPVAPTRPPGAPAPAVPTTRPAGALARVIAEPAPPQLEPAAPKPPQPAPPVAPAPTPGETTAAIASGPSRSAGGVRWRWPAEGTLVNRFAVGDPARQGIDLRGRDGAAIVAAADGEVVYSGNGLVGYGELIIIKHSAEFLSAYGHNRRRLVTEGQRVKAGQAIAEMGRAPSGFDALHFEIRRAGRPTDPLQFLPPR